MAYSTKSNIISRRIAHRRGLGYVSAHTVPAYTVRGGMGGSQADCSAGQTYYPNLTFAGIKGQCATPAQAQAFLSSGNATGDLSTAAASSSPGFFDSLMSAFKPPTMPTAPVAPVPAAGMSQSTMIAIGLGAVGLIAILLVATRK